MNHVKFQQEKAVSLGSYELKEYKGAKHYFVGGFLLYIGHDPLPTGARKTLPHKLYATEDVY